MRIIVPPDYTWRQFMAVIFHIVILLAKDSTKIDEINTILAKEGIKYRD